MRLYVYCIIPYTYVHDEDIKGRLSFRVDTLSSQPEKPFVNTEKKENLRILASLKTAPTFLYKKIYKKEEKLSLKPSNKPPLHRAEVRD